MAISELSHTKGADNDSKKTHHLEAINYEQELIGKHFESSIKVLHFKGVFLMYIFGVP